MNVGMVVPWLREHDILLISSPIFYLFTISLIQLLLQTINTTVIVFIYNLCLIQSRGK